MGPLKEDDRALERICSELQGLRGGVVDTSTLIYLDTLKILPMAGQWLQFVLTPQVIAEFGRQPEGIRRVATAVAPTADDAVVQTAVKLGLPILSEDGRVLRQARRMQHPHYNTLMLLLALHAQGKLSYPEFTRQQQALLVFARYSSAVIAYGERVLQMIRGSADHPLSPQTE